MRAWVQYSRMRKPHIRWGIRFEVTVQGLLWVGFTLLSIKIGIIAHAGTDTFLTDVTPFISLMIASIAANATISALRKTREALELTRKSQRPFLSVVEWDAISIADTLIPVRYHIHNTGVFPADKMSVELDFFAENELVESKNTSSVYVVPVRVGHNHTIVFPGSSVVSVSYLDQDDIKDKQILDDLLARRSVKLRARITYQSNINSHIVNYETLTTAEIRAVGSNEYNLFSMPPQEWT